MIIFSRVISTILSPNRFKYYLQFNCFVHMSEQKSGLRLVGNDKYLGTNNKHCLAVTIVPGVVFLRPLLVRFVDEVVVVVGARL